MNNQNFFDPKSDDYQLWERHTVGRIAYINPFTESVGIVTNFGDRILVPMDIVNLDALCIGVCVVYHQFMGHDDYVDTAEQWLSYWLHSEERRLAEEQKESKTVTIALEAA